MLKFKSSGFPYQAKCTRLQMTILQYTHFYFDFKIEKVRSEIQILYPLMH